MFLPDNVMELLSKLHAAGYEAYAVGGAVRDSIMGRSADDYDIATSALPAQTEAVFAGYRVIETGIQHGTVTVIAGGAPVEITTFRVDGSYSDNRHPDEVTFTTSIEADLSRRDFTVNAIAYAPGRGYIDPFGGRTDIDSRRIRCVGAPDRRFDEDALRILRALRFASVLDFSIASATAAAIHAKRENLSHVAAERLQKELVKLLKGSNVFEILTTYNDVIFGIIPALTSISDWTETCRSVQKTDPSDGYLRLAMLFYDTKSAAVTKAALRAMKFSNRITDTVSLLVACQHYPFPKTKAAVKRFLQITGEENFPRYLQCVHIKKGSDIMPAIAMCAQIKQNGECWRHADLAVNGADVGNELHVNGPQIGKLLNDALNAVIDERCKNTYGDIISYLKGEEA